MIQILTLFFLLLICLLPFYIYEYLIQKSIIRGTFSIYLNTNRAGYEIHAIRPFAYRGFLYMNNGLSFRLPGSNSKHGFIKKERLLLKNIDDSLLRNMVSKEKPELFI